MEDRVLVIPCNSWEDEDGFERREAYWVNRAHEDFQSDQMHHLIDGKYTSGGIEEGIHCFYNPYGISAKTKLPYPRNELAERLTGMQVEGPVVLDGNDLILDHHLMKKLERFGGQPASTTYHAAGPKQPEWGE